MEKEAEVVTTLVFLGVEICSGFNRGGIQGGSDQE